MANSTLQETALAMANQLIALCQTIDAMNNSVVAFNQRNTDNSPDTQWRLMATAAFASDGSIGAADGTPNLAHPITVGGLNRAEADLLPGLTLAIELAQFFNGTLPTGRAQVNRLTVIHKLIG